MPSTGTFTPDEKVMEESLNNVLVGYAVTAFSGGYIRWEEAANMLIVALSEQNRHLIDQVINLKAMQPMSVVIEKPDKAY